MMTFSAGIALPPCLVIPVQEAPPCTGGKMVAGTQGRLATNWERRAWKGSGSAEEGEDSARQMLATAAGSFTAGQDSGAIVSSCTLGRARVYHLRSSLWRLWIVHQAWHPVYFQDLTRKLMSIVDCWSTVMLSTLHFKIAHKFHQICLKDICVQVKCAGSLKTLQKQSKRVGEIY